MCPMWVGHSKRSELISFFWESLCLLWEQWIFRTHLHETIDMVVRSVGTTHGPPMHLPFLIAKNVCCLLWSNLEVSLHTVDSGSVKRCGLWGELYQPDQNLRSQDSQNDAVENSVEWRIPQIYRHGEFLCEHSKYQSTFRVNFIHSKCEILLLIKITIPQNLKISSERERERKSDGEILFSYRRDLSTQ